MSKIAVVYQSKYGATKKYAEWLAKDLACDLFETRKASIAGLQEYDTVIFGGGIYATGIAGISFLKKNIEKLAGKKICVFAVGASPYYEKAVAAIRDRNFKGELSSIPLFYCRGSWDEDKMTWKDRTLCNMLKQAVAKKDPARCEPWESSLLQATGAVCDWTDREYLQPMLGFVRE